MAIKLDEIYKNKLPKPMNSGVVGDGGVSVNAPSTMMENDFSKYLYDSGLQNVFNDYQQNIATLNQQEQQQLQNAYTIREMSKKYLGEYASNMGIGDVSGNLLDIYSQYQQNVGDIMAQSDQLALNLQQTFQQQSEQAFQQALQNQEIQLAENAQTVLFNISRGDLGGQDWSTYLQSALDSGEINESQYQQLFTTVYASKMDELETNFSRGFFGFKTDSSGERVPMSAQEYLEQNKSWLTPQDYQRLSDMMGYNEEQGFGFQRVQDTSTLNLNLQLFLPSNTPIYTVSADGQTFYYARMNVTVDEDNVSNAISTSELMTAFREENPGEPLLSGQTIYEYNGTFYVYEDRGAQGGAAWYRMYNASNLYTETMPEITDDIIKGWNEKDYTNKVKTTDYFEYDYGKDIITSKDGLVTWELDGTTTFSSNLTSTGTLINSLSEEERLVLNEFRRLYNDQNYYPKKHDLIVLNGIFYAIDGKGKLQKFKKKA